MPPKKRAASDAASTVSKPDKKTRSSASKTPDTNLAPASTTRNGTENTRKASKKKVETVEQPTRQSSRIKAQEEEEASFYDGGDDAVLPEAASEGRTTKAKATVPTKKATSVTATKATKKTGAAKGKSKKGTDAAVGVKVNTASEKDGMRAKAKVEADQDAEDEEGHDGRSYWLMKAEPESRFEKGVDVKFSIDDLRTKDKPEPWDGVRNPTARNNMRSMRQGDLAFFYHSNCKVPGIAGVMEIVQEHSVDESAFDPGHPYYDEKSVRDSPKWCVVGVEFRKKLDNFIKLKELQKYSQQGGILQGMQVLKMSRLSVSRVTKREWDFICELAAIDPVSLESVEADE